MAIVEFGGVLQGQDQVIAALFDPGQRRLSLGRRDSHRVEVLMTEKVIGRLGGRPIPTKFRDRASRVLAKVADDFSSSFLQPFITQFQALHFRIDPIRLGHCTNVSLPLFDCSKARFYRLFLAYVKLLVCFLLTLLMCNDKLNKGSII